MNLELILAIAGSTFTIIATIVSLFLWIRTEANADRKHLDSAQSQDRRDFITIMNEIKLENKDFHYRLLDIERNRKP